MTLDKPLDLNLQFDMLSRYIYCDKKKELTYLFSYEGYFNISKYAKFALSKSNKLGRKPNASLLITIYNFDNLLRSILFTYCKKAELFFKNSLSYSVSKQTNTTLFYLDKDNFTPSQSAENKSKRKRNILFFDDFFKSLIDEENKLRSNLHKYPEFFEIRHYIKKSVLSNIPCWAMFPHFDFGTVTNIYYYLNSNLRTNFLKDTYTHNSYTKAETKEYDSWLSSVRNLRNICAHNAQIVGTTSNIVKTTYLEDNLLDDKTSLFARLYALKKVLPLSESNKLASDINKVIDITNIDVIKLDILPNDWDKKYAMIQPL